METARISLQAGGRTWIYTGVRVDATIDLTRDRDFASLDIDRRLAKAVDQQRGWLESLLGVDSSVDLRYLFEPASGKISCFVLSRISAEETTRADDLAGQIINRLMAAPPHLQVVAIDESELRHIVTPFVPDENGRAEIRKRVDTGRPNRPDAGVERYWAVSPLRVSARSWSTFFGAVTRSQFPVLISICLDRSSGLEALGDELDRIATYYSKLAREVEWSDGGLYKQTSRLSPEAFAQDAQLIFADMSRRYRGRVHSLRISVSSPAFLDDGVLELLSTTISPPEVPHEGVALNGPLTTSTTEVVRVPQSRAEDFDTAIASLSAGSEELDFVFPEMFRAVAPVRYFVDTREATAAFRLPIAETGTLPGFDVRSGDFNVASAGPRRIGERSLTLGHQLVNGRDTAPFTMDLDDLTMHAFVVGTTGSGKTSTCLGLLERLWLDWKIPWMVIEPVNSTGNDYRMFLEREGFEECVIVTVGDDAVAPLRLNLFEVPIGVTVGEHLSSLLGVFDAAFGLWDPLPAIYRKALEQTYFEAGFSMADRGGHGRWPSLQNFIAEMVQVTNELDYSGEIKSNIIAASRVRVEQLATGPLRSVFDSHKSTPLTSLLERPVIVELARLGASNEQEIALVIAALMSRIAEERRAQNPSRILRHVLLVEEAHKLLRAPTPSGGESRGDPSGAAARLFADLLAEIRKYGQSIIVADQDPAKLVPDAYKNTNLKIMHRLPAESDRRLVGGTMRFDDDHIDQAASVERFTAFVYAEGYDRPGLVRFLNIREGGTSTVPSDEGIKKRYLQTLRADGEGLEVLMPYAECVGCKSVCVHRSWAHATASRRAVKANFRRLSHELVKTEDRPFVVSKMADLVRVHVENNQDQARCLAVHLGRDSFDRDVITLVQQILD
jgi:hypothetical protein